MRILLIGLGRWGRNHLAAWRSLGVDLRVCDHSPDRLDAVPERSAMDYRELLNEVDAVDVVTPAPSHHAIASECLARGKHVFVEKPLAQTAEEGLDLDARARAAGRILQVGHVFRFAPAAAAVAGLLAARRIGDIRYLVSHFMSFKRPRSDGGVAISDAVHMVDLISWLLGRQPLAVGGILRDHLGRGMDDLSILQLDYGEEVAVVAASYSAPRPCRDLQVIGSEGAITCDFLDRKSPVRIWDQSHRETAPGAWEAVDGSCTEVGVEDAQPLTLELAAFAEACATGRPSPVAADGYAGAAAVAVIETAARAAASGATLPVKLPAVRGGTR